MKFGGGHATQLGATHGTRFLAAEDEYRKAEPTRIFGVGIGVFLVVFFFIVSCGICWIGTLVPENRTLPPKGTFTVVGTAIFGIVALVLLFADPEPQFEAKEDTVVEYRQNFAGLAMTGAYAGLAAVAGLGAVACYHVCLPMHAPLVLPPASSQRVGVFDRRTGRRVGPGPPTPL